MAAAIDPRLGQYPRSHPRTQPSLPPPNGVTPLQNHPQLPSLTHSRLNQLPPLQPPLHHSPPPYQNHYQSHHQHSHPSRHIHDSATAHSYYSPHHVSPSHHQSSPTDQRGEDDSISVDDPNSPNDASLGEEGNGGPGSTPKLPDAKRPRACDSCRGLKVKCIIDPSSGEPCKRCAKAGRQCIVTPPARKRQKKADGRVAELERKIDALTASLAQRDGKYPEDFSLPEKREYESYESSPINSRAGESNTSPLHPHKRLRLEKVQTSFRHISGSSDSAYASQMYNNGANEMVMAGSADDPTTKTPTGGSIYNQKGPIVYDHSDIDERIDQIISRTEAERLFNRYVEEFVPHFPAVPFPPGTTAQQIRSEKPILFLAILSGTSYGANIADFTQVALEKEIRDVLATCMWKNGEKSIQLVQALQVTALWYRPPANFEQHMFYQMVHMSTIMAIDIGIGKRQNRWKKRIFKDSRVRGKIPDPEGAECRRAWLVNYFLCITIAMVLRRPILLRYNDYMRDCLEALETSEGSLPSDKSLCQHIHLARISEDIAIHFAMDDPAVNLTISDSKVSYGIKHHEQALADLRARNVQSPSIQLTSHVTNLFLHEIALHSQNNVDDFKAPFMEESFRTSVGQVVLGPGHVDALLECQTSCRKVIETFLIIDFDAMFVLPVIFSVRIIYAVVVLIKLHIAATTPGEMSNIIKEQDLHLEEYLEKLEDTFKRITEKDLLSPHTKFLYVIQKLIERYNTIKVRTNGTTPPVKPKASSVDLPPSRMESDASPLPDNRPASAGGFHPSKQAQGLHLLSEVAMSNSATSSPSMATHHVQTNNATPIAAVNTMGGSGSPISAATVNRPLVPHNPQPGWYQPAPGHHHGEEMLPIEGVYEYPGQLGGFEGLDFGFAGLGMGVDGAIGGLFMDSGPLWPMPNIPDTFLGGWPG